VKTDRWARPTTGRHRTPPKAAAANQLLTFMDNRQMPRLWPDPLEPVECIGLALHGSVA